MSEGPQYIVTGQLDKDIWGLEHLSMPIGPFPTVAAAEEFMTSLLPLWGEWEIVPLWSPHEGGDS